MKERIEDVDVQRPWQGDCATTGKSMEQYAAEVDDWLMERNTPAWVKRAAIAVCRAYGIRGISDPAYICNVITRERDLER